MAIEPLQYDQMVEEALRSVIRRALAEIAEDGLSGKHQFYITFLTDFPGVDIPDHLHAQHPGEMTIVLEHQFWGLEVGAEAFEVTLSFNKANERLTIPFEAITAFADPAVNFVLQLKTAMPEDNAETKDSPAPAAAEALAVAETTPFQPGPTGEDDNDETPDVREEDEDDKMGEVIALDTFRKK